MNKISRPSRILAILLILPVISTVVSVDRGMRSASATVQTELRLPFVGRNAIFMQGTVTGIVTDASNGFPLEGVPVCATPTYCSTTGPDGAYNLSLYPGYWVLSTSLSGYYPVSKGAFVLVEQGSRVNISMSPLLTGENRVLRIVLTWSVVPTYTHPISPSITYENDLDAHLWVQSSQPTCHIQPYGVNDLDCPTGDMYDCTTFPYACLETQVRLGAGPETISIGDILTDTQQTHYYYGILNYNQNNPGVPQLSDTGAHVDVYNESGLLYSFDPPANTAGNFWYLFNIEGMTGAIQPVDCITDFNPVINYEFPDPPPCQ